jgi:hypothetical protein
VKLAIDAGWLTPARQVGLAVTFGAALIAGGLILRTRDEEYAGLLPAAGVIVLYLSAYGARLAYGLLSTDQSMVCAGAVTAVSLWLYSLFRHDFYAVTAAVGSYLFPLLMTEFRQDHQLLFGYVLFWGLCFSVISITIESRALPLVASFLGIGLVALIGNQASDPAVLWAAAVVQLIQLLVFAVGVASYSIKREVALKADEAMGYFLVLIFFYGTEYHLINRLAPDLAPWISLGCAAFLYLVYFVAGRRFPNEELRSRWVVEGFASVVLFHSGYLVLLPDSAGPLLLLIAIYGTAFLLPSILGRSRLSLPGAALGLVVAIEYGKLLFRHDLGGLGLGTVTTLGLACAAGFFLLYARLGAVAGKLGDPGYVVLTFGHVQCVMALYRFTQDQGSLALSIALGIYALLVLAVAFGRKDEVLGRSSLIILMAAAGKALLYDASSASPVVRVLCLGLTGAVLYTSGYLFRRFAEWRS